MFLALLPALAALTLPCAEPAGPLKGAPGPLAASSVLYPAPRPSAPYGYLWHYVPDGKGGTQKVVKPYEPREGDILFFDDMSRWWTFLYSIAHTAPPFHAGIVFKKHDGSLAALESGPDDTLYVYILDLEPRLHQFSGAIQVRQCKKALCPEESKRLTEFAYAQEGKRYAMWRLLLQGTPVKSRGPLRHKWFAKTYTDRDRWLCAEIVVSAGSLVGIFPPTVCGTDTYPLDIVDDKMHDLSATLEPAAYWSRDP